MTIKSKLLKRHIANSLHEYIDNLEIDENKIVNSMAIDMLIEIKNIVGYTNNSDFESIEKIIALFNRN